MPLSEEELRLLEQMERALVEEDPKLASTLRGTAFRRSARRRAIIAGVCFLVGVAVLMTGAVAQITVVGIAGFVVMLLSATIALTAMRGQAASGSARPAHGSPPQPRLHRHRWRPSQPASPPHPQPLLLHGADGGALAAAPRERRVLSETRSRIARWWSSKTRDRGTSRDRRSRPVERRLDRPR